MKVGIKFCGGCNPRYDRRKELSKLQAGLEGIEWISESTQLCDYWLVSCGCARECVDTDQLLAKQKVLILGSLMDYKKARGIIEEEQKKTSTDHAEDDRKHVRIGMEKSMRQRIDETYVMQFAKMTGDYNRLHMDKEFAEKQWFGQRVAHGMIGANLLAAVLGTEMPGDGAVLLSIENQFCKPILIGDTIIAKVRLVSAEENRKCYIGQFAGECCNEEGECLITMKASQMMLKNLFYIEKENEQ